MTFHDINETLKSGGWATKIAEAILPQMYAATSIAEYKANISSLRAKKFPSLCLMYPGAAVVVLPSADYHEVDENAGHIKDLTDTLDVLISGDFGLHPELREVVHDNMKLYVLELVHRVKDETVWLRSFYSTGPPTLDAAPDRATAIAWGYLQPGFT